MQRSAVGLAFLLTASLASAAPKRPDGNQNGNGNGNQNGNANYPPPPPHVAPPPAPPPLPRYLPADHAYEPKARFVHQLGWILPVTISDQHVTLGFYGLTYSARYRKPYDRDGVLAKSAAVGNEWGIETRLLSSYRTHSGITTTISLAPLSQVRRKDWPFTFPSLVGALLPEAALVIVNPKEIGGRYRAEVYLRHLARFQFLIGRGILALEAAPFVQVSFPLDGAPRRLEGGLLFGISTQIPPKY